MSSGTLYLGENAVSPSVASALVKYSAGENIKISNSLEISAKDTTYSAGTNITIDTDNKIHAKEYKSGKDIEIAEDGTINSTALTLPDPAGKELAVLVTDGVNASWEKQATFNLLDRKESNYILDDIRWLRADTFSWQSGDLYPTVYEHLVEDFEAAEGEKWYAFETYGGTPEVPTPDGGTTYTSVLWSKTNSPAVGDTVYYSSWEGRIPVDTIASMDSDFITLTGGIQLYTSRFEEYICANLDIIGGVHIWYWKSPDGHKIINPYHIMKYDVTNEYGSKIQSEHLEKLFQTTGGADYFILDKNNKRFKLPRQNKRKITHAYKQGSNWYNLYSDGWVEQGGVSNGLGAVITLPVAMRDTNYTLVCSGVYSSRTNTSGSSWSGVSGYRTSTTTITLGHTSGFATMGWQVSGYAAQETIGSLNKVFEYYYVGEYQKTSLEQIAGISTEQFNAKVDTGHEVVAFQRPTPDNNYTWYRKYADGWVEQGGNDYSGSGTKTITLPITMKSADYTILTTTESDTSTHNVSITNRTTTSFVAVKSNTSCFWQVSGMAA
jgi:hypothetical protein